MSRPEDYPGVICRTCALSNHGRWPEGHVATFYPGKCGWCGKETTVTEPRDWRYPDYDPKKQYGDN